MKAAIALGIAVVVAALAVMPALAGGPTQLGLKADGLRLQAIADRYGQLQGLKADGLRWQAMARAYAARPTVTAPAGSSFNWTDAGIGVAGGLGIAAFAAVGIGFVRHSRRTKLAL